MSDEENVESRIRFIIGMFKHYQPDLTIPEQIALLTLWEESCVLHEEYEMAAALKKEMEKIQKEPINIPQKNIMPINIDEIGDDYIFIIKEETKKTKKPTYKRFFGWVKKIFRKN